MLTARLLSISSDKKVRARCLAFLQKAREVSLQWTRDLSLILSTCENEEQSRLWTKLVLEVGLTCHGTFDVDSQYLPPLLESERSLAILVECSIPIHNVSPAVTSGLPSGTKWLLDRFYALLHRTELIVLEHSIRDPGSLDEGLKSVWTTYRPGGSWTCPITPVGEWLETTTCSIQARQMTVHYNVLNGSLLINGSPLARLPRTYESHASYTRLFGEVCALR